MFEEQWCGAAGSAEQVSLVLTVGCVFENLNQGLQKFSVPNNWDSACHFRYRDHSRVVLSCDMSYYCTQ